MIIEFPEIEIAGNIVTVHVRFGSHSLFDDSKGKANPEDVPIKPKETYVLTLDEEAARAWEVWQKREKWPQPKKIGIEFEQLNFGDGTGFFGGNGAPWPFPKPSESLALPGEREFVLRTHHARVVCW